MKLDVSKFEFKDKESPPKIEVNDNFLSIDYRGVQVVLMNPAPGQVDDKLLEFIQFVIVEIDSRHKSSLIKLNILGALVFFGLMYWWLA